MPRQLPPKLLDKRVVKVLYVGTCSLSHEDQLVRIITIRLDANLRQSMRPSLHTSRIFPSRFTQEQNTGGSVYQLSPLSATHQKGIELGFDPLQPLLPPSVVIFQYTEESQRSILREKLEAWERAAGAGVTACGGLDSESAFGELQLSRPLRTYGFLPTLQRRLAVLRELGATVAEEHRCPFSGVRESWTGAVENIP